MPTEIDTKTKTPVRPGPSVFPGPERFVQPDKVCPTQRKWITFPSRPRR